MNQDLLQPSIEEARSDEHFSIRSIVLMAFFGGGIGAVLYLWLNSSKLKRLNIDLTFLILVLVFVCLTLLGFGFLATYPETATFMKENSRMARYVGKLPTLAIAGLYYLRLKSTYQVFDLKGVAPLNPWVPAIGLLVLGIVLNAGLILLGGILGGIIGGP